MTKVQNDAGNNYPTQRALVAELAAKIESLRRQIDRSVTEIVRAQNERLLKEHRTLKPLLSVKDVAKTLGVSKRTVEKIIAEGHLRPLWVKGQRRFHPDAVDAYIRRTAGGNGR